MLPPDILEPLTLLRSCRWALLPPVDPAVPEPPVPPPALRPLRGTGCCVTLGRSPARGRRSARSTILSRRSAPGIWIHTRSETIRRKAGRALQERKTLPYPPRLAAMRPYGPEIAPVATFRPGMPSQLERAEAAWLSCKAKSTVLLGGSRDCGIVVPTHTLKKRVGVADTSSSWGMPGGRIA